MLDSVRCLLISAIAITTVATVDVTCLNETGLTISQAFYSFQASANIERLLSAKPR